MLIETFSVLFSSPQSWQVGLVLLAGLILRSVARSS